MKLRLLSTVTLTVMTAGLALTSEAAPGSYGPQPTGLALTSDAALSDMDRRLATIDLEIARDKKELETIAPLHTAGEARIRARGRRLYRLIRAGLMPLSGGFAAFVEHAQKVEGLKRALASDLAEEHRLETRGAQLAGLLDALAKERTELSDRKGLAEAAKIAIDEERSRREAFERAFASSMGPKLLPGPLAGGAGDEIVVYGPSGKMPLESVDPSSFKARKGRLTFPVSGQAEVKAMQKDGGPGVEIVAPLGAVVRAVHPGRVAFADRYGVYGQLVILDHGERCYTVSANLGSIDVKVGDELSAGERLGTVGDDGRGPSLYFEIRIGNDKVPPQTWLGL